MLLINVQLAILKKTKVKLTKKEKFILIIFTKPKERYIADLNIIQQDFLNIIKKINFII